jgi:Zn-dependent oligopeptidase
VNEIDTKIPFTEEQLDGLPTDFIHNLPIDPTTNKRLVSLKYPELFPVLEMANNEETRKTLDTIYAQQCLDTNIPILKEILRLRYEAALLNGFDCDASYVLRTKMAKNIGTVKQFLENLSEKLTPLFDKEFTWMCELKREQYKQLGKQNEDIIIYNWDTRYYQRMILEKYYHVDDEILRTYFPMQKVVEGMLDIYQQILGVKFVKNDQAPVWHPDVQRFSVFDQNTNEFKGHFYLDLWPRTGKYTHAACFPLQVAFTDENGHRHYAASAMVTNFTKPTPEKPSLLKFKEVTTLFHEFGHVMHSILANATYSRLNWRWNAVEQDFLEAPSMMFENWCYEEEVLAKISSHYQTGEVMPKDLQRNLVKAKIANLGFLYRRLIFMSLFDLAVHSPNGHTDIENKWIELKLKHTKIPHVPGTAPYATWQHLTTGYNAGYYGYLWSEVISKDLYSRFQKEGVLSKVVGSELRRYILEPCAAKGASQLLTDFLKRNFNSEAFFKALQLT